MPRYRLTIEYDGLKFCGWQRQSNAVTVQGTLEEALICFTDGQQPACHIYGSGRTDTGVHATGQVAHVDLDRPVDSFRLRAGLNALTRNRGVSILNVTPVPDTFHARFSATKRYYVYKVLNRRAPSPLYECRAWHVPVPLNWDEVHRGASLFEGLHDFSAFRSAHCSAPNPVRTVDTCFAERQANDMVYIHVQARAFLHNQVRAMVGTLMDIGRGRFTSDQILTCFETKDRASAGQTAPPYGLYFTHVFYEQFDEKDTAANEASFV